MIRLEGPRVTTELEGRTLSYTEASGGGDTPLPVTLAHGTTGNDD